MARDATDSVAAATVSGRAVNDEQDRVYWRPRMPCPHTSPTPGQARHGTRERSTRRPCALTRPRDVAVWNGTPLPVAPSPPLPIAY